MTSGVNSLLIGARIRAELFACFLDRAMKQNRGAVVERMRDRRGRENKLQPVFSEVRLS